MSAAAASCLYDTWKHAAVKLSRYPAPVLLGRANPPKSACLGSAGAALAVSLVWVLALALSLGFDGIGSARCSASGRSSRISSSRQSRTSSGR